MAENRLNIITALHPADEMASQPPGRFPSRLAIKKEMQAKFERLWLIAPEQFNPLRNCMQKERLERTWSLLSKYIDPANKFIADIGCGAGVFSRKLRDAGARVEAIDIAENALKHLRKHDMHQIQARQDAMPSTSLPDQAYEVVICTEVIAELPPEDFRLFFSELSRLVQANGYVICSSPIDIYTQEGAQRLLELAQTELTIIEEIPSYHALYLKIKFLFEIPSNYVAAWRNRDIYQKELKYRAGLSRLWLKLNASAPIVWVWDALSWVTKPVLSILKNSRRLLLLMENICRFIWDEEGISHLIFIAKRRPLQMAPETPPIERPKKKEIWE